MHKGGIDLNYQIKVSTETDQVFKTYLRNQVRQFNQEVSSEFKKLHEIKVKPFHIIVNNNEAECIGGLTGRIIWDWLEVDYFWLSEKSRSKGIGREVLVRAEAHAKGLGVSKVLLMTFEFQARSFYEKHGYKVVGEIKDYPPGSVYYTMVKHI